MQLQELMLDVCSGLSHLKFQYWLYHSIINTKALFLSLLEVGMACIAVNLPSMWFLISHVTPEAVLRSIRSVVSLQSLRSTKSRQSLKDKTMRSSSYPWGGQMASSTPSASESRLAPADPSETHIVYDLESNHAQPPQENVRVVETVSQNSQRAWWELVNDVYLGTILNKQTVVVKCSQFWWLGVVIRRMERAEFVASHFLVSETYLWVLQKFQQFFLRWQCWSSILGSHKWHSNQFNQLPCCWKTSLRKKLHFYSHHQSLWSFQKRWRMNTLVPSKILCHTKSKAPIPYFGRLYSVYSKGLHERAYMDSGTCWRSWI